MLTLISDYLALILFVIVIALLFTGFPIAFSIGGASIVVALIGLLTGHFQWIEFSNISARIWSGGIENVLLIAVSLYILMGAILQESGVSRYLLQTAEMVVRRVPGSLAVAVVLMGVVLAATTGVIGASVMILTMLAFPELQRRAYGGELSTGVIASSATLGILIPPSIMLLILGDMLAISAGRLFFAAMYPGLILASLFIIYIILRVSFDKDLKARIKAAEALVAKPEAGWETVQVIVKGLVAPTVLIGAVLGSIFFGLATPTESAGMGVFGSVLLARLYGNLTWDMISRAVWSTLSMIGMVFLLIFAATTFAYVFRSLGGDHFILNAIAHFDLGSWELLLVILTVIFLLGFVLDWMEIVFIMVPVLLPVFQVLDFGDHVGRSEVVYWIAILIAVCLQTSFLTPPVGFALFYMKAAAGKGVDFLTIYRGIIPFVILQLIGLIAIILYPEIALWLPRQMVQ